MTGLGGWGGWLVPRRPESTKAGHIFLRDLFIVFLNSPHRDTPKNVIKKNCEKIGVGFFVDFFVKTFRHDFFLQRVCSAFELPSPSSTRKRNKTEKVEEK
jgi:hypothetical protein